MTKDDSFLRYVLDDCMREISGISSRRMFDGWGLYKDGIFFGLVHDGTLYCKVDAKTQPRYEALASRPFVYVGHGGKKVTLTYWEIPAEIVEDATELSVWVEDSYRTALRDKKKNIRKK